jgi:hypothetical protein
MVSPLAILSLNSTQPTSKRRHSPTIRLLLCHPKYLYGHINTLHGIERVPHIKYTSLTFKRFKRATLVSLLLSLRSSSHMGRHDPRYPCSSRSMGSRARDATAIRPRSYASTKGASFLFLSLKCLLSYRLSQTLRILADVDSSVVELYFSQRLQGLGRSVESYEDEVLSLLEVIEILAGEDAELYARSIRDVLSPHVTAEPAGPDAQRNSQVLERAVENVLSSLRDGETTFGENVATTLLTPLAEVEADTSFSPTMMVVLTALACEYAGHVPVSPVELLRGLGKRLMSYPRQCIRGDFHLGIDLSAASIQEISLLAMIRLAAECRTKLPPEPISDVQHLKSKSGRHISRVSVLIYTSHSISLQLETKPSEMFFI